MTIFTFHFAETTVGTAVRALCRPPTRESVPGLCHAECMTEMTLGAPIVSPARMQLGRLTMFAAWESEEAIDAFLAGSSLGRALAPGWHVRMAFQRRWGSVGEFDMVRGHSAVPRPERHAAAMVERQRKDFHFEFTTLRFRPISEHGQWDGRTGIIPA